jgi:hypothetical protein
VIISAQAVNASNLLFDTCHSLAVTQVFSASWHASHDRDIHTRPRVMHTPAWLFLPHCAQAQLARYGGYLVEESDGLLLVAFTRWEASH